MASPAGFLESFQVLEMSLKQQHVMPAHKRPKIPVNQRQNRQWRKSSAHAVKEKPVYYSTNFRVLSYEENEKSL